MDFSVPLTHHGPRVLGLICLVKKRKVRFRIPPDLRIQSWIFFKKRTHIRAKTRYVIGLEPTIFDKINKTSGPPLPSFQ